MGMLLLFLLPDSTNTIKPSALQKSCFQTVQSEEDVMYRMQLYLYIYLTF